MTEVVNKVMRTITGRVVSAAQSMTRTVVVKWSRVHPLYGKVQRKKTKYYVHDPKNESNVGDLIEIVEVAPISKTKIWQLVKVVEQAK